ncbi:EDD domain protein, DegV family [Veillonellaceae bacterium DNF00626]|nr:EDD domain protein, DegV family [Veillonellaceae bacterium DNF00626]
MIHIIVDSTAAISDEFLKSHDNLHVVPLFISINGEYVTEEHTSIDEVIDYSERTKTAIPTSQPSTGDFLSVINSIPPEDDIIMICLSKAVSGTYNGALLAAKQSGRKNISVIHSRSTAIGMVHLVRDAYEMMDAGLSYKEICEQLAVFAGRIHTSFTIPTLDFLRRGGRVGKAAGLIGSILKIRPCIYLNDNDEVDVLAKVRTEKKGVAALVNYLHEHSPCKRIGIVHIKNIEGAKALQATLQAEYPGVEVTVSTGTPILACYLGPGLVGIIFESA